MDSGVLCVRVYLKIKAEMLVGFDDRFTGLVPDDERPETHRTS